MKKRNISRVLLKQALVIPAFVGLSLGSLNAASLVWDSDPITSGIQDGTGVWGATNPNWWDGTSNIVWSDGAYDVVFGSGGTAGNVIINSEDTGNGAGVRRVHSILFEPVTGGTYTIQGGRLSFSDARAVIGAKDGAEGRITSSIRHSGDIYIGNVKFSGTTETVTPAYNGRIILTQSLSSLTGNLYIRGGVLRVGTASYLPTGLIELKAGTAGTDMAVLETNGRLSKSVGSNAGNIRVAAGLAGFSAVGGKLTIALGNTITLGSTNWNSSSLFFNTSAADSALEVRNNIEMKGADRFIRVDSIAPGTEVTLSGAVTSTGQDFSKLGLGTLILAGTSANTDLLLKMGANVGTVILNKSSSGSSYAIAGIKDIGTGSTVKIGDQATGGNQIANITNSGNAEWGSVFMSGGTFDLNGHSEGFFLLGKSTSASASTGLITSSSAGLVTLTLGLNEGSHAGQDAYFKGIIQDGSGVLSLVKTGSNKQILQGVNTYTGSTTIDGGTLRLEVNQAINSNSEFILKKGTLEIASGVTQTITKLDSVSSATISSSGTINFDAASSLIIVNSRVSGTSIINAANKTLSLVDPLNTVNNLTIKAGGTVNANTSAKGTTVIEDGGKLNLTIGTGLLEGKLSGNTNKNAYTGTAIKERLTYGLATITKDEFGGDNVTWAYTGMLYLTEAKTFNFRKTFDDWVYLKIGSGTALIDDGTHTNVTIKTISLQPGYYSLDIRYGNGTGGVGPGDLKSDFGLGYNTGATTDPFYEFIHNPSNGIYFVQEAVMANMKLGQGAEVAVNGLGVARVTGLVDNVVTATPGDLIKTGTGLLQLDVTSGSYYNGITDVREGTLKFTGNVDALRTTAVSVSAGAKLALEVSAAKTFASAISGQGTISKSGTAALTLSNIAGFTGDLIVEQGRLKINNATSGNITVWSGAELEGTAGMSITNGTLTAGRKGTAANDIFGNVTLTNSGIIVGINKGSVDTLTFDGKLTLNNSTIRVDLGSSGADKVVVKDMDLTGTNKFLLNFASDIDPTKLAVGNSYVLLHVNSIVTNESALTMDVPRGTQLVYDNVNKDYVFSIIGKLGYVKWTGENSRVWDTATSNWVNVTDGQQDKFHANDFVLFDDSARYKTVNLTSDVTVYSMTVDSDMDYIFSGNNRISGTGLVKSGSGTAYFKNDGKLSFDAIEIDEGTVSISVTSGTPVLLNSSSSQATVISGSGTLDKSGSGTLILWGNNTYGNTTVSEGTLQIGNGGGTGTLGRGNVYIAENANLAFNLNSTDNVVYGAISGAGSFSQIGTGTVILDNANTYSGGTKIAQGTVSLTTFSGTSSGLVSSSVGSGAVSFVNNTGTLSFAKAVGSNWVEGLDNSSKSIDFNAGTGTMISYATGTLNNNIVLSDSAAGTAILESGNSQNVSTNISEMDPSSGDYASIAYSVSVWTTVRLGGKISGGNSSAILNIASTVGPNGRGIIALVNQGNDFIVDRIKISGGSLLINHDSVLGNASNKIELAVGSDSNGGLLFGGEGIVLGASRNVIISANSIIDTDGYTGTIAGVLSGPGKLVKEGLGTLVLTGNSSGFSGGINVKNGTIQIGDGTAGQVSAVGTGGIVLSTANSTLVVNSDDTTIANNISGIGSFVQDGVGSTTLAGNNTFTGSTTIKRGELVIGSATALAAQTKLEVLGGGLDLNGYSITVAGLNGNTSGSIINNGASLSVFTVNNSYDGAFAGIITDGNAAIALTKSGAGTLALSGVHSYGGNTTVTEGTLLVSADNALINSAKISVTGGSAAFAIGETTQTVNNIEMTANGATLLMANGSSLTVLGNLNLSGAGNLIVNVDLGYRASEKSILNANLVGSSGSTFVKDGAGTLVLNGSGSSFGGDVLVSSGTLEVSDLSALGTGGLSIGAGTFAYAGGSTTISNFKASNGLTHDASTISVTDASSVLTVQGSFGGSGSLNKTGAGTLVINTAANYSGATRVTEGTLQMGTSSTANLPIGTNLIIEGTGTFDLNGNNNLTIGGLSGYSITGVLTNSSATAATLTVGSSGEDNAYYGKITGNVVIEKEGSGILVLAGKNTSTGDIILKGGTIRASEGLGLSTDSALILIDGTLESRGRIVRDLGNGAGQIQLGDQAYFSGNPDATIGFAAVGGRLIVNIGNEVGDDRRILNWDPSSASSDIFSKELVLGSLNATNIVEMRNDININGNNFVVNVIDNLDRLGDYAVISGSISGTGNLIKEGIGTLVLTGNAVSGGNVYTGDTYVNAGVLKLGRSQALSPDSDIMIGGDTVYEVTGQDPLKVLTILDVGSTSQYFNSLNFNGTTQGGTLRLSDGGSVSAGIINVDIPAGESGGLRYISVIGGTGYLYGTISGGATLVKNGEGKLIVQNGGASGFTGGFNISQGVLEVNQLSSLGSGNLEIGDATFRYTGGSDTFSQLGEWALQSNNSTIEVVNKGTYLTISSVIGGISQHGMNLVKTGAGTLVLAGAYTGTESPAAGTSYDGNVIVKQGTVQLGVNNGMPKTAAIEVEKGAMFDLNGYGVEVVDLLGTGTITSSAANTGNLTVNRESSQSGDQQFGGNITGNLNLIKEGDGVLTLSGNNTYTGQTIVKEGVFRTEGKGLSSNTQIVLLGGAMEFVKPTTAFSRRIGDGAGAIKWKDDSNPTDPVDVWFSASGGPNYTLGISLDGGAKLKWDDSRGFLIGNSRLVFGSEVQDSNIEFRNALDLGSDPNVSRTIVSYGNEDPNVTSDLAIMTGVISGSSGLIKTGDGVLRLANTSNTYSGPTTIKEGVLEVTRINDGNGYSSLGRVSSYAQNIVIDGGTLRYVGKGEYSDKLFSFGIGDQGGRLESSGTIAVDSTTGYVTETGAIRFDSEMEIALVGSGERTLTLGGSNKMTNELRNVIRDSAASQETSLLKVDDGKWLISSEQNSFSGPITVNGGWLKFVSSRAIGGSSDLIVDGWATSYHEKNGGYVDIKADPITKMNYLPVGISVPESSLSSWVKDGQIALTGSNELFYLDPGVHVYKQNGYSYFLKDVVANTKEWAVYKSDNIALLDSSESSTLWSNLLAGGVNQVRNGKVTSGNIQSGDKILLMDGGRLVVVDFNKTVFSNGSGQVNPQDKQMVSFENGRQGYFDQGDIVFYDANKVVLASSSGVKNTFDASKIGTSGSQLKANTMGDSEVNLHFDSGKLAYTATKVFYRNGGEDIEVTIDANGDLIDPDNNVIDLDTAQGHVFVEDGTSIKVNRIETIDPILGTVIVTTTFIYKNEVGIWNEFNPGVGKNAYVSNSNKIIDESGNSLYWKEELNAVSDSNQFTIGDQYVANKGINISNGSLTVNSDNEFVITLDQAIGVVGTTTVAENGKAVKKDTYKTLNSISLTAHQMIALSEGEDVILDGRIAAKIVDNQITFREIATLDLNSKWITSSNNERTYEEVHADLSIGYDTGIGAVHVDSDATSGSALVVYGNHTGGTLVKYGNGDLQLHMNQGVPAENKLTFNVQEGTLSLYGESALVTDFYAGISDLTENGVVVLHSHTNNSYGGVSTIYNGLFDNGSIHMSGGIIQIDSGVVYDGNIREDSANFSQREKISKLTGYGNIVGIYDINASNAWEHSAIEVNEGYFAGTISDNASKMYLIKTGDGTLVLHGNKLNLQSSATDYIIGQDNSQTFVYRKGEDFSNQNTYSGRTFLHGGTISTFGDNVLSARSTMRIVASGSDTGGLLKLNGFTQTVGGIEMIAGGNANFTGGIDFGHGGYLISEGDMLLRGGTIVVGHNSGNVELDDGSYVFRLARTSAESQNYVDSVVLTSRSLNETGGILLVDSIFQITSIIDFGNGTGQVQISQNSNEVFGSSTVAKTIRVGEGKDVYFQSFKYTDPNGRGRLSILNMVKDGSGTFILKKDRAITPIIEQNSKIRIEDGILRVANVTDYSGENASYAKSELEAMFTQATVTTIEINSHLVQQYNVDGEIYETISGGTLDLNNTTQYIDSLVMDKYAFDVNGVRSTTELSKARVRLGGKDGKLLWNAANSSINGGIIDLDNYSDYTHQSGAWFSEVDLGTGGKLRIEDLSYWGQQRINVGDGTGKVYITNSTNNEISGAIIVDGANREVTLNDVFVFSDGLTHDFNLVDITKGGTGALVLGDNVNITGTGAMTIEAGRLVIAQTASVPGEEIIFDKTIQVKEDPYSKVADGYLVQRGSKTIRFMGTESNDNLSIEIQKGMVIFEKAEGQFAAEKIFITPLSGESAILKLVANDQIYDQGFIYMNGGTFDMNGKSETVASIVSTNVNSIITNDSAQLSTLKLGNTDADDRDKDTIDYYMGRILAGSGNIALVKEGEGTLVLTGDNTYSGGTTIIGGTLYIENANALGSSVASNVITFKGSAEKTATLSIYSDDDVVLKNNLDIQGVGIFDIGNKVTLEGEFLGTDPNAVLIKKGKGILELSDVSNETFNGTINVEAGTLIANRDVGLVDINILDGATLKGSGSIALTMTVEKGGILAPGNSVGHYSVGELELLEGSISQIEFDALNSDQITSLGDVTITKGAIMEMFTMVDIFEDSTLYDVFLANGSVEPADQDKSMFDDASNGLTLKYDLAFFNPHVIYEIDRVQVQMDRKSYAEFGKRKSEKHTGGALDNIHAGLLSGAITDTDMRDVVANLAPLTNYQGHKALQALSGSIHAQGEQSRWLANERFRGQVENRINKFDPYDFETKESLWAHTFGYTGDTDDDNTNIGYDYKGAGIVGGYDYRTDNYGVIGLAFYYEDGKAETKHETSKIDDFRLMAYISQEIDEWSFDGSISYGFQQYDTNRTIQYGIMDARRAKASYDGDVITLSGDVAYAFDENLSAIGGLDIERVSRDGFKEKGAGAAGLKGDSDDNIGIATRLGFRYTIDGLEDDAETRLYAQAFWKHRFNDDTDGLDATFIGAPGNEFSVESSKLKRDSFIIGLGFESLITDDVSWYGDANAEFSGSTTGFGGNVGIRYNW